MLPSCCIGSADLFTAAQTPFCLDFSFLPLRFSRVFFSFYPENSLKNSFMLKSCCFLTYIQKYVATKGNKKRSKAFVPLRGRSQHLAVGVVTNLAGLCDITKGRFFRCMSLHTLLGREVTFEQIFWSSSEVYPGLGLTQRQERQQRGVLLASR